MMHSDIAPLVTPAWGKAPVRSEPGSRPMSNCYRRATTPARRASTSKWLTSINEITGPSLTTERMTLKENRKPQPTGAIETLEADAILLTLCDNGGPRRASTP